MFGATETRSLSLDDTEAAGKEGRDVSIYQGRHRSGGKDDARGRRVRYEVSITDDTEAATHTHTPSVSEFASILYVFSCGLFFLSYTKYILYVLCSGGAR